ncbi:MAG: MFS transporter [Thaumarchaeota archaeon]|nr:MFS transporter [Nitrososphaerota archaeon]
MSSLVPYAMVTGTVATLVQLYIIQLGGTVIDVGLTTTLGTAVSIPSVLFWGAISDRVKRRPLIVVSFASTAALLLLFLLTRSVFGVALVYALYCFVSSAPTTPINLLILGTSTRARWASSYARYQLLATVGNTLGLLISSILAVFVPLVFLVILLSGCSFVATGLAAKLIFEPVPPQDADLQGPESTLPTGRGLSPKAGVGGILEILRADFTGHVGVLYSSLLVFYVGTGLTLVVFVPFLHAHGISNSEIFGVSTVNLIVMGASFWYFGGRLRRESFVRNATFCMILRAVTYAALAPAAYLLTGWEFYLAALILTSVATGLVASPLYTITTGMVYESLGTGGRGASLGIYSAVTGACIMLGEFAAGYISFYSGYFVTLIIAGACFGVSALIISKLRSTPLARG